MTESLKPCNKMCVLHLEPNFEFVGRILEIIPMLPLFFLCGWKIEASGHPDPNFPVRSQLTSFIRSVP